MKPPNTPLQFLDIAKNRFGSLMTHESLCAHINIRKRPGTFWSLMKHLWNHFGTYLFPKVSKNPRQPPELLKKKNIEMLSSSDLSIRNRLELPWNPHWNLHGNTLKLLWNLCETTMKLPRKTRILLKSQRKRSETPIHQKLPGYSPETLPAFTLIAFHVYLKFI